MDLIFIFSLSCIDWVGSFYANKIFYVFFFFFFFWIKRYIGTQAPQSPPLPPPVVYCTDRSKAVVPVLVLLFVALWFILWGDLFYVLPCDILFLCFSVLLALRLHRLGKRELVLVLFVRLFDLRVFGFACFLFLLVSEKGCGLRLWQSLEISLTFCLRKKSLVLSNSVLYSAGGYILLLVSLCSRVLIFFHHSVQLYVSICLSPD